VAKMIPPDRNQPIQLNIAPDFFLLVLMALCPFTHTSPSSVPLRA
jgi:hypothetical protein